MHAQSVACKEMAPVLAAMLSDHKADVDAARVLEIDPDVSERRVCEPFGESLHEPLVGLTFD